MKHVYKQNRLAQHILFINTDTYVISDASLRNDCAAEVFFRHLTATV